MPSGAVKGKSNIGRETVPLYVHVFGHRVNFEVFFDRRALRKYLTDNRDTLKCCYVDDVAAYTYYIEGINDIDPNPIGSMLFNRKDIDLSTVAHECVHMTCLWTQRAKIPTPNRMEWGSQCHEDVAEFCGELVAAVVKALDSHGIKVHNEAKS